MLTSGELLPFEIEFLKCFLDKAIRDFLTSAYYAKIKKINKGECRIRTDTRSLEGSNSTIKQTRKAGRLMVEVWDEQASNVIDLRISKYCKNIGRQNRRSEQNRYLGLRYHPLEFIGGFI